MSVRFIRKYLFGMEKPVVRFLTVGIRIWWSMFRFQSKNLMPVFSPCLVKRFPKHPIANLAKNSSRRNLFWPGRYIILMDGVVMKDSWILKKAIVAIFGILTL